MPKTYREVMDCIHDASGVIDPTTRMWEEKNGVYYPVPQKEKFKLWVTMERCYLDENDEEKHEDDKEWTVSLGEFHTMDEAYEYVNSLTNQAFSNIKTNIKLK